MFACLITWNHSLNSPLLSLLVFSKKQLSAVLYFRDNSFSLERHNAINQFTVFKRDAGNTNQDRSFFTDIEVLSWNTIFADVQYIIINKSKTIDKDDMRVFSQSNTLLSFTVRLLLAILDLQLHYFWQFSSKPVQYILLLEYSTVSLSGVGLHD